MFLVSQSIGKSWSLNFLEPVEHGIGIQLGSAGNEINFLLDSLLAFPGI